MGTDALRPAVFRLTHITDVISLDFREALGHYFAPDFFAYFFSILKFQEQGTVMKFFISEWCTAG